MFDFTGPTTVHIVVHGPTAADITAIVAAELAAALTPIKETLMGLNDELQAQSAAQDAFYADVQADLAELEAQIANPDTSSRLDIEGQAIFDRMRARFADARAAIPDADHSDDPQPEPTPEPEPATEPETFSAE